MIPVKTLPKFKCDFCKKRSTAHVIAVHEKRCFRNPNRFCDFCNNEGFTVGHNDMNTHNPEDGSCLSCPIQIQCPYCAKFNTETLEAIKKYEGNNKQNQEDSADEIPF